MIQFKLTTVCVLAVLLFNSSVYTAGACIKKCISQCTVEAEQLKEASALLEKNIATAQEKKNAFGQAFSKIALGKKSPISREKTEQIINNLNNMADSFDKKFGALLDAYEGIDEKLDQQRKKLDEAVDLALMNAGELLKKLEEQALEKEEQPLPRAKKPVQPLVQSALPEQPAPVVEPEKPLKSFALEQDLAAFQQFFKDTAASITTFDQWESVYNNANFQQKNAEQFLKGQKWPDDALAQARGKLRQRSESLKFEYPKKLVMLFETEMSTLTTTDAVEALYKKATDLAQKKAIVRAYLPAMEEAYNKKLSELTRAK